MAKRPPSLARRAISAIEPSLQHNGFAYTFTFVYILINVIVFFLGAAPVWRSMANEGPTRFIATAARGGGALLNFNSAIVILVAARNLMTYLRQTVLNMIVPFDKAMPAFHSLVGNTLVIATVIHGVFQVTNYIRTPQWSRGVFGKTSIFITGTALTIILVAMRITSLPAVRRRNFELFYWVHSSGFVAYFLLLVFHGVHFGKPATYRYITVPLLIYCLDRLVRLFREKASRLVVSKQSAVVKGADMVCLRVPRTFSYLAGQYCDIKVPAVSKLEWHPFTIASSPHQSEMLFYIKVNGDWTKKLHELCSSEDHEDITILVRGPYGAPAQHVGQYEHVVLISGGVGATPFASITKYAHHWILNYTPRGLQASTSVSAAFTRNQSTRNNSVPSTPTKYASGYSPSAQRSRDHSRNISRNISRNMSRNVSYNPSRNGSRAMSRSNSGNRFDRASSTNTVDSIGIIIQEQRMNQPHGPTPLVSSRGDISLEIPTGVPPARAERANDLGRFLSNEAPHVSTNSLPDDYVAELGDPDAPIPERRSGTPGTSGPILPSGRHMMEEVREYDSSKGLFDDEDEDDVGEAPDARGLEANPEEHAVELDSNIEFEGMDLEIGGIELEDEILREQQTASNAYQMMGMSFGSAGLLRHFQAHDNVPMRSSMMRASMNLMDDALDAAVWQDRLLFYLHTVTVNWLLLWIMILRFSLVAMGRITSQFSLGDSGLTIYSNNYLNAVDLVLALLLLLPVGAAIVTEIYMHGFKAYFQDQFGNFFDALVLLPLMLSSVFLTALGLADVGTRAEHVSKITVFLIWPLTSLLLLWRIGRTIGSRISLAQYFKSTHSQTKSLDFVWVSKTPEDDSWLIEELLPLAGSGIVRLHRFITRHGPTTEPWMLDFEKVPLRTTYKRPDWDEVFGNLVERSRSGTVIGVFFCGPDVMARSVQQAAMKAMAKSVENAYQRGYLKNRRVAANPGQSQEDDMPFAPSRPRNGMFSRVSSRVGEVAKNLSWKKPIRPVAAASNDDPRDPSLFGCNVRISVRIENFT